MLKHLTLAAFAAALLPACVLNTDNTTTSVSETATGSGTDGTTGSASGTTTGSAGTTSDSASGSGTDTPTTDTPTTEVTTTATTTAGTTDATTTDATTGNTTGMSATGMCGWNNMANYYACAADGGTPGAEDPLMMAALACPDGLMEGAKCDDEMGPVTSLGCCTPEGTLYYCDVMDSMAIFKEECGA